MKNKLRAIVVVLVAMVAVAVSAQVHIGPRVGLNVNSLHFNKDVVSSDNRAGFTAGMQIDILVPVVGIGMDASVMYVRRSDQFTQQLSQMQGIDEVNKDYISVPLNLKWKISIPAVGQIISPYIFTGPAFSFLTSKQAITDAIKNKKFDISWNFGAGVELFKHLQVGASYGIGMSDAWEFVKNGLQYDETLNAKNKFWTITAAYLF